MKVPKPIIKIVRTLAGLPDPGDDFWYGSVGTTSLSGQNVTPESSLKTAAVFACVRLLAETIAGLPLIVYSRLGDGGKTRAVNHPLYELLHNQPNSWQTAFEFVEMMQGHLELRGNAYAEIISSGRGFVGQLIPLHPDKVQLWVLPSGRLTYRYREKAGAYRDIDQDMMFHIRGWGSNGYLGTSPIALAAESVGMSLAAQEYGARFFRNDATPGGVLSHPSVLKKEAADRLRESWKEAHTGDNRHKVAILEEDMKYTQLGLTNKDAQFLESRKFQAEEVARIFRVPPHKIGLLDKATFSNIEHQAIEFVVDSIVPRVRRWEQAIKRDLILQKGRFFAEFLVDGLLRGDMKSRYEAYAIGRNIGLFTINDLLRLENMNPIGPEGDTRLEPMNMQQVQPGGGPAGDEDRPPPTAAAGKSNGQEVGFDDSGQPPVQVKGEGSDCA